MEKKNTHTGKVIAVILIFAFVGINFYRTEKEGGPQEQMFADQTKAKTAGRNFEFTPKQDIEKLKFAYTGKWEKNEVSPAGEAGNYAFTAPENTRSKVEATAAKKVADKKKTKKIADKKKSKKTKTAKKFKNGKSLFDDGDYSADGAYATGGYYTQPKPQTRTPSDTEENEPKKLTAQELLALVMAANSIAPMTTELNKGTVTQSTDYATAGMLLSSETDETKKLGFEAIAQFQSVNSLVLYAKHINDEMSPETRAYAEGTLSAYNNPSNIKTLNITIRNPNNTLKIISSGLIKDITSTLLQSQAQTGENVVYTPQQIALYKVQLRQSLAIIETALETDLDSNVMASFNSTRNILLQFLR